MHAIKCAMLGTSRDVADVQQDALRRRQHNEDEVRTMLARKAPELVDRFDKILGWTRYWTQALNDRHGLAAGQLWEKEIIWEVGTRLCREGLIETPEDVLLFPREDLEAISELEDVLSYRDTYVGRKSEYRRNSRLQPPDVIGRQPDEPDAGSSAESRAEPATAVNGDDTLEGTGFAGGEASGRARPVADLMDPSLLESLTDEDILILPHDYAFFYADWHSLLMLVKGVVSPGRLSHHLSQVARECGVPVIGHVKGDLGRIPAGSRVHISGESGLIRLLSAAE